MAIKSNLRHGDVSEALNLDLALSMAVVIACIVSIPKRVSEALNLLYTWELRDI